MIGKKAGEKYLSIWWFFVLIVIAGGLVAGVLINSKDTSIKEIEADILATRLADCIVKNGWLDSGILEKTFDVFEKCYLSKEAIESGKYYLALEAYEFGKCEINKDKLECKDGLTSGFYSFGASSFEIQCKINGKTYPKCSEKYIYVLDEENGRQRKLILRVIAGSNQEGKHEI